MSRLALLLITPLGWGHPAFAATYFVDAQNPLATDTGPGTDALPYRTIGAALNARGGPGTTLLVRPGVYREQVVIRDSGTAGNPLTIRSSGGAAIVDGSNDLSATALWVQVASAVWLAGTVTARPRQVFLDGARIDSSSASPDQIPPQTWRWVPGSGLHLNVGGGNPGLRSVQVGARRYGFQLSRRSHVVIEGFQVTRAENYGINVADSCTAVIVARNTLTQCADYGIRVSGGSGTIVEGNTVSETGGHGIGLIAGATGCTVRDNDSFANANPVSRVANGIYLFGAPANTFYRNLLHENQDSGIHLQSGSDNCVLYLNRAWNNGDHGYDHLFARGTLHSSEMAYGNFHDGFSIEGNSTGTRIWNCIAIENGITDDEYNLFVDASSVSGLTSDYNIFWNSGAQAAIKYGGLEYPTLAGYQAASGQDPHTIQANPRFVNAPAGDFHLLSGSPAIDSGDSGALFWQPFDAEGLARVDHAGTSNTGAGPITYGDRGAFEYSPGDRAPIVAAPATQSGDEYVLMSFSITVTDPDGDAIPSLEVTGLPRGATFAPLAGNAGGTLTWTPGPGQAGSHVITFTARNARTGVGRTAIEVTAAPRFAASIVPLPIRLRGTLRFQTTVAGRVTVDLFDTGGRLANHVMDQPDLPPGSYVVEVPGTASRPLRPGVYFYRVRAAEGSLSGRLVVVE